MKLSPAIATSTANDRSSDTGAKRPLQVKSGVRAGIRGGTSGNAVARPQTPGGGTGANIGGA